MVAGDLPALLATFGPVGGAAIWMYMMTRGREVRADPAAALTEELRAIRKELVEMRERMVRVETKLESKPTRAR